MAGRNVVRNNAESFWALVEKGDGCCLWKGRLATNGYGKYGWQKREVPPHRIAWELTYGPIPKGLHACHHCDVRHCVRPDHLFLGTRYDNMRDCARKGRNPMQQHPERSIFVTRHDEFQVRGERQGHALLTTGQVLEIRRRVAAGHSVRAIAGDHLISQAHVRKIAARKAWAHV